MRQEDSASVSNFGGIDLHVLAERYQTPLYVYDWTEIESNYQNMKKQLPKHALIAFAVKACSNIAILQGLNQLGAYFEVVSPGEYMRLRKANVSPKSIIAGGLGKDLDYLQMIMRENPWVIQVESLEELDALNPERSSHNPLDIIA